MKKKKVWRLLAAALVLSLTSSQVMASSVPDGQGTGEEIAEVIGEDASNQAAAVSLYADEEYHYDYLYVAPNNSVTLSPSDVNASKVVDLAYPIIFANEGDYTTVTANDNGAVSIGKIQWHGNRALALLRETISESGDVASAKKYLGEALYAEVTASSTSWSGRILTSAEASSVKTYLKQTSVTKTVQDKMAKADIAGYVNHGIALGIRNVPALIYFADLENQGGYGRSSECAKTAVNASLCSSYSKLTLNELYIAAVANSVMGKSQYLYRRGNVYKACANLGYTYCQSWDRIMPCVFTSFTTANYVGEAWLQWALNAYGGANLSITDKYDSNTIEAIKAFQTVRGLKVDGQAGRGTIKELTSMIVASKKYSEDAYVALLTITTSQDSWTVADDGENFSLGAKCSGNGTLTYASSNTAVATVSAAGEVDPVGAGTATITIGVKGLHITKTVTVTVTSSSAGDNGSSGNTSGSGSEGNSGGSTGGSTSQYPVPTRTLKTGSSGDDVKWLQSALNSVMGAGLAVDGKFGNGTYNAVKKFQQKYGLSVDGAFGPASRAKLASLYGGSTSGGSTGGSTSGGSTGGFTSGGSTGGSTSGSSGSTGSSTSQYPVPTRTLKKGTSGEDVKWLQSALNSVMGAGLTVDGKFGNGTYNAVKKFQQKYGLSVDGAFGPASRSKLVSLYGGSTSSGSSNSSTSGGSSTGGSTSGSSGSTGSSTSQYPVPTRTLKKGTSGNDVKWLQSALNKVMGAGLAVDGKFGNGTYNAVKKFQQKYGLTQDGIFGPASRKKMTSLYK